MPYSSCHFPNDKSVFLQIWHHSSVTWKITSLYFFRSNVLYFAQKKPIKVEIGVLRSKFSWNFASLFSVMRHKYSILFLAEILYTFSKRNLWKYKFSEISREQSKVWNFAVWWVPLFKSYKVSGKRVQNSYLSWHFRAMQSLKKKWLVVLNMTGISWIFTQQLRSLKISLWWALLVQSIQGLSNKNTEELSFMTLNSDAKFQ